MPMNNRLLRPLQTPGLLDLVPGAAAAYSLRSLSRSYADPVVTVRRSSDNAEDSFTAADVADGTLAAFCGAGDGFVKTWFDQSGNRDASQSSSAAQPQIVDSGSLILRDGKPIVRFNGTSHYMEAANVGGSAGHLFATVYNSTGTDIRITQAGPSNGNHFFQTEGGQANSYSVAVFKSSAVESVTRFPPPKPDQAALFALRCSGADYSATVNGAEITPNVTSGTNAGTWMGFFSGPLNIASLARVSIARNYYAGDYYEILIYTSALDAVSRQLIEGNTMWYY